MSRRIDEAYRLLKASGKDTDAQLKRKYREAIRQCHPDSTGNEDALEEAKKINEAYEKVVKHRKTAGSTSSGRAKGKNARKTSHETARKTAPRGYYSKKPEENSAAFSTRTFYRKADPFGDYDGAQQPVEAGEGRFLWDPDLESFAFLMMSVRKKCMELLRGAGIPEYGDETLRLFHLMMREYIRPWECLVKLSEDLQCVRMDESGRIHIDAENIIMHSRNIRAELDDVEEGDEVSLEEIDGRLCAFGHLSFAEDALYYLCLMLYESGRMHFRATVKKKKIRRDVLPYTGLVLLDIEITDLHPEVKERPESHGLEIAEILKK